MPYMLAEWPWEEGCHGHVSLSLGIGKFSLHNLS